MQEKILLIKESILHVWNQLHWIDATIIFAYLLLSLCIGLWYKSRAGKSTSEYFLGGRNMPWLLAGLSMVATTFAADTPLAVTELVATDGISGNWLWWNALLGGMLTTFFFAKLWRRAEIMTELELIEVRYSGLPAKFLRGFKSIYMGVFMNVLILGWVNLAMASILQVFFNIPADKVIYYIAALMLLTAFYSTISGIWGVAVTDAIQFLIAMSGCIILAYIVLHSPDVGGVAGLKASLPDGVLDFFPSTKSTAATQSGSSIGHTLRLTLGAFLAFTAFQWWASWYPGAEPGGGGYIAQRMMSAKDEQSSVFATLFFQIAHYCLRPWPWIIVALCALSIYNKDITPQIKSHIAAIKTIKIENGKETPWLLPATITSKESKEAEIKYLRSQGFNNPELMVYFPDSIRQKAAKDARFQKSIYFNNDTKLGYVYAMQDFLPEGFRGLLLVAFLAAYMSTISTQLNWGASYLINDFYRRFLFPENTFSSYAKAEKNYLFYGKIFTIMTAGLSLYATTLMTSISGVWSFIIECGAGLGLVLILRWMWWRINAWSEIAATIAPFIGFGFCKYIYEPYILSSQGPEALATFNDNRISFFITIGFTTIAWIVTTFVTKPESKETLESFYLKVRPNGYWTPIRKQVNMPSNNKELVFQTICWISSIIMVYCCLFGIGEIILIEYDKAIMHLSIAFVAGVIMVLGIRKIKFS